MNNYQRILTLFGSTQCFIRKTYMTLLYRTKPVDNTQWYSQVVSSLNECKNAKWHQPIKQISTYAHSLELVDYPNICINITFHGDINESLIMSLSMKHSMKLSFIDLITILSIKDLIKSVAKAQTILYKEVLA